MPRLCPYCNGKVKGNPPDITKYFNCQRCGRRLYLENDGELVDVFDRKNPNPKMCEMCGRPMSGGEYVVAWENGNNPDGYIVCPHCGHVNFEYGYDD